MSLAIKQKRLKLFGGFVLFSTVIGGLLEFLDHFIDIKSYLQSLPWWPTFGILFGVVYIVSAVLALMYLYQLDPGVQLRKKSMAELENIIVDDAYRPWHSHAIMLLEKKKDDMTAK